MKPNCMFDNCLQALLNGTPQFCYTLKFFSSTQVLEKLPISHTIKPRDNLNIRFFSMEIVRLKRV